MNQRFKVLNLALVTYHQAAEVLQPRVCPLNEPAPLVAPQALPVLMRRHPVVAPSRDDRLNRSLDQQRPRIIAVISAMVVAQLKERASSLL